MWWTLSWQVHIPIQGWIRFFIGFPGSDQVSYHCYQKVSFELGLVCFPWFWLLSRNPQQGSVSSAKYTYLTCCAQLSEAAGKMPQELEHDLGIHAFITQPFHHLGNVVGKVQCAIEHYLPVGLFLKAPQECACRATLACRAWSFVVIANALMHVMDWQFLIGLQSWGCAYLPSIAQRFCCVSFNGSLGLSFDLRCLGLFWWGEWM